MLMLWMLALVLLVYWDLRSVVHHWQRQTARYSELRSLQEAVDCLEERVRATENRVANAEGNIKTASALSARHTDNVRADLSASLSQHVEIFRMEQQLMDDLLGQLGYLRTFIPRTLEKPMERKARYSLVKAP